MGHNHQRGGKQPKDQPIFYRTDLINGAVGAQRLTNEDIAQLAKLNPKSVAAVRNGAPNIGLPTLKAVLDALGLTLREVFEPKPETVGSSEEGSQPASAL
jgi:transcriptional regulator with XRE-family HTH domain